MPLLHYACYWVAATLGDTTVIITLKVIVIHRHSSLMPAITLIRHAGFHYHATPNITSIGLTFHR